MKSTPPMASVRSPSSPTFPRRQAQRLPVRMWTNGAPNQSLVDNVRNEITRIQRSQALQASGLTPRLPQTSWTSARRSTSAPRRKAAAASRW